MAHSMNFFRRNLKPLMAALTLMSMISFVFMDDSMQSHSRLLIPLVFGMFAGGAAFIWGTRSGRQNEFMAMGFVVGIIFGLTITTFSARDDASQATLAGLTQRDIFNLKNRREKANRIVASLYRKSHPIPKEVFDRGPFMLQFYQMQVEQALSRVQFNFGRDLEQDVVFGHLLRQEGQRLGIVISDEAISDFIKMVANNNLSTGDFQAVRQELNLTDHHIYEILRDELVARRAAELTFPRIVSTPEQLWQDFRKIAVKQQIQATTIPVDPFVKSISEPSSSQLSEFFKEHVEKFPGLKGEPGFRQPNKVRLAYLEADYEAIEAKMTPPSDEVVATYYADNKEFYREKTPPSDTEKLETDKPDGEPATQDGEKKDGESNPKPDLNDKSTESKAGDKPKEKEDKPEPEKEDKPEATDNSKGDKPKEEKPAQASKSESQGAAGDDQVASGKDAEEKPTNSDDKPAESKQSDESKTDKPKEETKKEAPSKDEPKAEDAKKDAPDQPANATKTDDDAESKPKKSEPRYKSFEEVRGEILDKLLKDKTVEEMRNRADAVVAKMRELGSYFDPKNPDQNDKSNKSRGQIAFELKTLADNQGLKYVETTLLSAAELSTSEEYKVGQATDPLDNPQDRSGSATVVQNVFDPRNDSTYTPDVAQEPDTKNRFAYWVIERVEAHVPTLEEIGVREQVIQAWKLSLARPKAEERAKEIAKQASDDKKPLTEVIAGQTVTGGEDGLLLTVVEPPEFAHYTQQGASAPQLNPLDMSNSPVESSKIAGLDKIDDEFLKAVHNQAVETTTVIPNADRSAFIVVHLMSRTEIPADEEAPQRKDFLEHWAFSRAADQLASVTSYPLRREWSESLERKYGVTWPVK